MPLDLSTISEITKKLAQAREAGVMMMIVHKPDSIDGESSEAYPDVIACNFTDWKLAAAMLGNETGEEQ